MCLLTTLNDKKTLWKNVTRKTLMHFKFFHSSLQILLRGCKAIYRLMQNIRHGVRICACKSILQYVLMYTTNKVCKERGKSQGLQEQTRLTFQKHCQNFFLWVGKNWHTMAKILHLTVLHTFKKSRSLLKVQLFPIPNLTFLNFWQ